MTVLVLGAGVVGLSTAIAAQDRGLTVAILAERFPSDPLSIAYTSHWAGAHHVSVATAQEPLLHSYDKATFIELQRLLAADSALPIMLRPQTELREHVRLAGVDQFTLLASFHPDFRMLDPHELPAGVTHGAMFTTIMIDTPNYLAALVDRFVANGGTFLRATLPSLAYLFDPALVVSQYSPTSPSTLPSDISAVVNCTGIGAFALGDTAVYPTRGQTVLVHAPWIQAGITRTGLPGQGIYTYIIPRKSGDVIVGGTAEADDWEAVPRPETSKMILERGLALCPELLPVEKRNGGRIEDIEVISYNAGLRPTRRGGIRIELETMRGRGGMIPLVSNYGHGGYGYQSSWGTAFAAVELLQTAL